jgi:serine/threonine-protein kinase
MTRAPSPSSLKVVRQLGSDAACDVFLATAEGYDLPVTVKLLKGVPSDEQAQKFLTEMASLARLNHPGLLRVLNSGQMTDGRLFALTEMVEAETLAARVAMPVAALVSMAVPVVGALEAAHEQGLVHGSLSARHVLLTQENALLDFAHQSLVKPAGADLAADVRALAAALVSCTAAEAERPLFETTVRQSLSGAPTAKGLREALEGLKARWVGDTRISGSHHPAVASDPQFVEPDFTGTTLGYYDLVRIIGEGAMGRVYLAKHKKIGREVAIKVMKAEHAQKSDLVQRFLQEATAVNAIKHEHIVDVHDFGEERRPDGSNVVYCVMELLQGKSVAEEMEAGPVSVHRAVEITRQVALALSAAHAVGVVHRDIKPDNIFLHRRGGQSDYVKVLDFGVAKLLKPLGAMPTSGTQAGVIIGTPEYMAPEQALGMATDLRVDLYALGLVLYELICGQKPFSGDTFGKLVVEITTKPPRPLSKTSLAGDFVPPPLADVVMKCLEKKPEERFASGDELAAALEPFTQPGALRVAATPTGQMPAHPADGDLAAVLPKRSALPKVLAAVVVLGTALAAVLTLVMQPAPAKVEPVVAVVAPPPVAAAPKKVKLELTSVPEGATVTRLDSQETLGTTPLSLEWPAGDSMLKVKFQLKGRQSVEKSLMLSSNVSMSVDLPVEQKSNPTAPDAAKKPKGGTKKGKGPVSREGTLDPFN